VTLAARSISHASENPEASILAALDRGEHGQAARWVVEAYGGEVLSFLAAVHGSQEDAEDAFLQACEDLVQSFEQFRHECSLRTWFYALAKNASRRHRADSFRRRRVAISEVAEVAAEVRTNTPRFLQTEWKSRLRALREKLEPEERALLVLRVDRQMAWEDIARVFSEPLSSTALRKRFERIKEKLRADAARDGWPIDA
jgi:RNA polymerase sigma-70 factor (ECF subfamily)